MDTRILRNPNFIGLPIGRDDMFGKPIYEGHIVAVRYAWNSYAAPIFFFGHGFKLMVTTSPNGHSIEGNATYQIIGHWDEGHPDYNAEVKQWIINKHKGDCPVKIHVYDNVKPLE
jgi:hypothetical protein